MAPIELLDSLAAPWIAALVNSIWQSLILTAAVAIALRFAKGLSASTRYAMWWVTLAATVALAGVNLGSVWVRNASSTPPAKISEAPAVERAFPEVRAAAIRPSPASNVSFTQITPQPASTPQLRRAPVQIRLNWMPLTFGAIWIVAALCMLARIPAGIGALTRVKRRATLAPDFCLRRIAELIQDCGLSRSVCLRVSEDLRTPVAAGLYAPAVIVPASLLPQLTESEFDQIAVHELAHLRRWDDWFNLIQRIACALFVFHPAVRFISRRLDLEREIACDDFVLERTGRPRDYAACLTRIVEISGWARQPDLAPGAAIHKSHIVRRVEKLLDRTRNAHPVIARRAVLALSGLLCFFVFAAARVPAMWAFASETKNDPGMQAPAPPPSVPALAAPPALPATPALPQVAAPAAMLMAALGDDHSGDGQTYTSYMTTRDDHHIRVRWTQNSRTFEMDAQGEVEFTDDDHDVKSLSPGGRFRIEEQGTPDRRYEVRGDGDGRLSRAYFESGRGMPMNDEGRRWLAERLPEIIRETGAGAEKRVQRILHQRGPDGVVAEIRLIRSDGSKRIYLQEFILHGNLDEAHLREGMRLARDIGSDGEKKVLLTSVAPLYLKDDLRRDLFDAVDTISSDGEHARALEAFIEADPSNRDTLLLTARSAKRIASDGEKTRLLISLADRYRSNEQMRGAWFATLNSVSSDGEKRTALSAIITRDGHDRDTLMEALKSASGISSDGERARLLVESSAFYVEDGSIRRNFFAAVDGISSDGEKRRVLSAIYQGSGKNVDTLKQILRSSKGISSDGEKASILTEVAGPMLADPALTDEFFLACDSISSDGDHARVLQRAIEPLRGSPTALLRVISSATRISSDGDKSRVLSEVIQLHSKDTAVRAALRKSLESVHSDGEYRKLSAALLSDGTV